MEYFKNLQFIQAASLPERRSYHEGRIFDGYYTIQYCHAGHFMLRIDDGPVWSGDGPCACLTFPGARFTYGDPHAPYFHLYVCFKGPLAESWRAGGLLRPLRQEALIPVPEPEVFFHKFEQMVALLNRPDRVRSHARAVLLLEELLLRMAEQQTLHYDRNHPLARRMNNLMKEVNRAPELEWDFVREARRMKISYSYFRRVFEELCGEPPHHFLLQCRLLKAAHLLAADDLQVGEIALRCGFQDEFYFSRFFKKHYGLPPIDYRKEYRL